jgi:hypothetical protein
MPDDNDIEHIFKNHMAIILGYADLLLEDMLPDDPRREDVGEIRKAAIAAAALFEPGGTTAA